MHFLTLPRVKLFQFYWRLVASQRSHSEKGADTKDLKLKAQATLGLSVLPETDAWLRSQRAPAQADPTRDWSHQHQNPLLWTYQLTCQAIMPFSTGAKGKARNQSTLYCKGNALGWPVTQRPGLWLHQAQNSASSSRWERGGRRKLQRSHRTKDRLQREREVEKVSLIHHCIEVSRYQFEVGRVDMLLPRWHNKTELRLRELPGLFQEHQLVFKDISPGLLPLYHEMWPLTWGVLYARH